MVLKLFLAKIVCRFKISYPQTDELIVFVWGLVKMASEYSFPKSLNLNLTNIKK